MTVATIESWKLSKKEPSVPPRLKLSYQKLRERFVAEAKVNDYATGFIVAEFMNRQPNIDKDMLKTQATLLAWNFRHSFPTHIIGIPDSGLPLAREVAKHFPLARFIQSQKEIVDAKPSFNWKKGEQFKVYSFTRQQDMVMHTENIPRGSRILIVDDVIAMGHAGKDFINELTNRGASIIGLAAGWDKAFQHGLELIAQTGIKVASTVSVTEMLPNNRVAISSL